MTKLHEVIGYDFKDGRYVIGTHDTAGNKLQASTASQADVDAMLAELGAHGTREEHELLGARVMEPIKQTIPYVEIYPSWFQQWQLDELDDWSIPVEDVVAQAWETHPDSEILYNRAGYSWATPAFVTFDTGIEVAWKALRRAGWNFLARQMKYATEALARKRDEVAGNIIRAAIPASHEYIVTGGALTKASIDQVLKDQAALGFPVAQAMVNPATLMAMGDFNWGGTNMVVPEKVALELLRTLVYMEYGGVTWRTNPFFPTTEVLFGGSPEVVGWHIQKGEVNIASDVDITKGVDLHAIRDADHAWYVGNSLPLARIRISA